jgi:hypothetical protein
MSHASNNTPITEIKKLEKSLSNIENEDKWYFVRF